MKKLLYFSLYISLFTACKSKETITPVDPTPIMKGIIVESILPNLTTKTNYSIGYMNEKVSNFQKKDSIKQDGVLKLYTNTNVITDGLPNSYTVVSDVVGILQTYKIEYSGKKVADGYEIIIPFNSSLSGYALIELNADNQMVKYSDTKTVSTDNNGVKRETLRNSYLRYEYDSKGNVVKVFQKLDGATTEILINEYTYDTNPNPCKPLLWFFRLTGFGTTISESNNNVISSKNYQQGVLFTESTGIYTYDSDSKYPLALSTSGKSYSPNTTVGTSKTTYKY
jgi:hypothetical protein